MNVLCEPILFNKVDKTIVVRYSTDLIPPSHPFMSPQFAEDGITVLHCRTDSTMRPPFPRPEGWTLDAFMRKYAPIGDLEAMEAALTTTQVPGLDDLIDLFPNAQVYDGPIAAPPPPPPPEPTLAEKKFALVTRMRDYVQARLDGLAASFGYDSIDSVAKYIESSVPKYRYEAKYILRKCDAHWDKCEELAIRYQNSAWEDIPVWEDLIAELPDLQYEAPVEYPPIN